MTWEPVSDDAPRREGSATPAGGSCRLESAGRVVVGADGRVEEADQVACRFLGLRRGADREIVAERLTEARLLPPPASAGSGAQSGEAAPPDGPRLVVARAALGDGRHVLVLRPAPGNADAGALVLANLAHELRTPLTTLRGALSRLAASGEGGASPTRDRDLLEAARRNVERLSSTVTKLVDLAAVTSETLQLRTAPTDPVELARTAAREHCQRMGREDVVVEPPEGSPPHVEVDARRIVQVLAELIENGCRFGPPGGVVEVTVRAAENGARIEVADRGPGIPEARLEEVLRAFRQGDMSPTRPVGGLGVGLAVAKAVVERHGGTLTLAPRSGGGTVATVELPSPST